VAYQNVAGQYEGTHTFLEWCKKRRIDIVFIGEAWVDKKGTGTQSHPSYTLGSKVEKGKRTMVYWRKKLDGTVKVIKEDKRLALVEVWGHKLGGIYADGKLSGGAWKAWLESLNEADCLVGDWNAHNQAWDPLNEDDTRGKDMEEWMVEKGFEIGGEYNGPTWERIVNGRKQQSRIDLFISRGPKNWQKVKSDKFLSDHWAIMAEIDWNGKLEEVVREKIDWDILGGELEMAEEDEEKGDFHWYDELEGNSPYKKLKLLRQPCCSTMRITEKSKRWWDEELSEQLKITRDARRGKGSNRSLDQAARIKRWKVEKDKMRTLVREKKKECW